MKVCTETFAVNYAAARILEQQCRDQSKVMRKLASSSKPINIAYFYAKQSPPQQFLVNKCIHGSVSSIDVQGFVGRRYVHSS